MSGAEHHRAGADQAALGLEAGIVTPGADALARFYADAFGFEVVNRFELPQGVVVRLASGGAALKLFQPVVGPRTDAVPGPWHRDAGFGYAALHVADVDAAHQRALAHGAAGVTAPTSHRPGARYAMVADPEGNVWELLQER